MGITLILVLAFVLRAFKLDLIPCGIYVDEASIAYNAYCISQTGKDEFGRFLPLFPEALGLGFMDPLYLYVSSFFIKILGPSIFSARFASCFLGLVTIFFTYKLATLYFERSVALLSAFLLAISPWHINFSRLGMGNITVPALIVTSMYFISLGIKKESKYLVFASIPVGLTMYIYPVGQLFGPLLYFVLLLLNTKCLINKKYPLIFFLVFSILIAFPVLRYHSEQILPRFHCISIANPVFSLSGEKEKLANSKFLVIKENKSLLLTYIFIRNYFKHFNLDFLLKKGDRNLRHNVGDRGQILWFTFWLSLVGFFCLLFRRKSDLYIFPIWFILFPVPAALTWDALPHAGRTIGALPVFEILAAVGFFFLFSLVKKCFTIAKPEKVLDFILSFVLVLMLLKGIIEFKSYLKQYFINFPRHAISWFDYDVYVISKETEKLKEYDLFLMPFDFNYVSFLFLQKVNPEIYLNSKYVNKYIKRDELKCVDLKKKIAMVVRPGLFPKEKTVGFVHNEFTGDLMYEIKNTTRSSLRHCVGKF